MGEFAASTRLGSGSDASHRKAAGLRRAAPSPGGESAPRDHAGTDRLRILQKTLNDGPHVRSLTQLRSVLTPPAAAGKTDGAGIVQRMRWRKSGQDIVPEDPSFRGPPRVDATVQIPDFAAWESGDVWDDANGNVYDGRTGFLMHNARSRAGDDDLLPDEIQGLIAAANQPNDLSTRKKQDSYRVRLNMLKGKIRKWLETIEPVERREGGYEAAADRAFARIDALQEFSLYGAAASLLPETVGARGALAHGLAADRLYQGVVPANVTGPGTQQFGTIDSRISDIPTGAMETVDTGTLAPQGEGLRWWASAAMGLRGAAATAARGALLQLPVGTGHVPIVLRQDAHHPQGEFIVLGHQAPVLHDLNPEQTGLRTPGSAAQEHRVSYPAFQQRLQTVHSAAHPADLLDDRAVAAAMLEMVRNPRTDPDAVLAADLPTLRELLATWLVAEPARHRSVILNGVLSLEQIAAGHGTFADYLPDNSRHPMTGAGTAAAGRTAEADEARVMTGAAIGDPVLTSRVVRRQSQQVEALSPGNLAEPLQNLLRAYGAGNVTLRTIPAML